MQMYIIFGIQDIFKSDDGGVQKGLQADTIEEQINQILDILELLAHNFEVIFGRAASTSQQIYSCSELLYFTA